MPSKACLLAVSPASPSPSKVSCSPPNNATASTCQVDLDCAAPCGSSPEAVKKLRRFKLQSSTLNTAIPKVVPVRLFSGNIEIFRQSGKKCFFPKILIFILLRFHWYIYIYIHVYIYIYILECRILIPRNIAPTSHPILGDLFNDLYQHFTLVELKRYSSTSMKQWYNTTRYWLVVWLP